MKTSLFLLTDCIFFDRSGQSLREATAKERTATPEETTKAKPKTKFFGKKRVRFLNAAIPLVGEIQKLSQDGIQYDLPDAVADEAGQPSSPILLGMGKKTVWFSYEKPQPA